LAADRCPCVVGAANRVTSALCGAAGVHLSRVGGGGGAQRAARLKASKGGGSLTLLGVCGGRPATSLRGGSGAETVGVSDKMSPEQVPYLSIYPGVDFMCPCNSVH
jgi:hypothetical protein